MWNTTINRGAASGFCPNPIALASDVSWGTFIALCTLYGIDHGKICRVISDSSVEVEPAVKIGVGGGFR
jgi:hypothetical protein